ncbi:CheR family methyltransferase [Catenovulum sediminis]|uniref:Chemotaxis protein methyltransferase n=1 Tax=Catenovulum sediminis TaxID=1740262 RepID=A0ABV1RMY1_9ALTE
MSSLSALLTSPQEQSADGFLTSISDVEYGQIRDYFYKRSGIYFDDSKRYFVDKRVISRIKATGHEDFRSYFSFLRFDPSQSELQYLVNLMTVNETYFFREEYQLRAMVQGALQDIVRNKQPGDSIRIWSLPCSTGEEAFSIALYLLEFWPELEKYEVEIIGSDIDTHVLQKAKRGKYSARSVKNLPKYLKQKYFRHEVQSDTYQLVQEVRECVGFTTVNLHDDQSMAEFAKFDLIFCRNLLIYFDDVSRRQAAERLFDALNPEGILFLGHSETMSRVSSLFKVRRYCDTTGYKKELP